MSNQSIQNQQPQYKFYYFLLLAGLAFFGIVLAQSGEAFGLGLILLAIVQVIKNISYWIRERKIDSNLRSINASKIEQAPTEKPVIPDKYKIDY